jgi:ectoine hydroxylase-related dioxygenase (phytanoyl-CoA dioxygenase family)
MSSLPGAKAQELHRDDKNHHFRHTKAEMYSKGRDMLLGLSVPACDTFKANGATRIVPGSHLWGDGKPDFGPNGDKGVINAELKRGQAFIMLGSLYHGAGNYSLPTGNRTVHIMFMCSGVYRQEVSEISREFSFGNKHGWSWMKLTSERKYHTSVIQFRTSRVIRNWYEIV